MARNASLPVAFTSAWAATLLALLIATATLWLPERSTPRVAPHAVLAAAPAGLDLAGIALVGWGLLAALRRPSRTAAAATLCGLLLLTTVDVLRWQAWAYHALLAGGVLLVAPAGRAARHLRWLTVGVYAASAVAKLDVVFADTLGQQMLEVVATGIGAELPGASVGLRRTLALLFPAAELLIAALLAGALRWPRWRPVAVGLACVQHVATIVILSPWGLDHALGVLVWNVGFATQTAALFLMAAAPPEPREPTGADRARDRVALGLVGASLLTPIAYAAGYGDAWLNWALYAPRGAQASVFVDRTAFASLPPTLQTHTEDAGPALLRLRPDDWTLAETGAPLYLAPRVTAALALAMLERYSLEGRMTRVLESQAERFTGERSRLELTTRAEIAAARRGCVAVGR